MATAFQLMNYNPATMKKKISVPEVGRSMFQATPQDGKVASTQRSLTTGGDTRLAGGATERKCVASFLVIELDCFPLILSGWGMGWLVAQVTM